jgi:hypothetical protein
MFHGASPGSSKSRERGDGPVACCARRWHRSRTAAKPLGSGVRGYGADPTQRMLSSFVTILGEDADVRAIVVVAVAVAAHASRPWQRHATPRFVANDQSARQRDLLRSGNRLRLLSNVGVATRQMRLDIVGCGLKILSGSVLT